MRRLRVVHPHRLLRILGRPRHSGKPLIETGANGRHLAVQLGALLRRSGENVFVDTEDCFVDARLDALELDDVNEWADVTPRVRVFWGVAVREIPELKARIGHLLDISRSPVIYE